MYLTNKPGASGRRSYLAVAIDSRPARLKSAAILIRSGANPNGGGNVLAQPIAAHLADLKKLEMLGPTALLTS